MARARLHLVCNAHLDPVWLWEWPEGAAAALATFRAAAGFCERRKGFVFCHNEALLYEWIESFEPALFRRIRRLVRAGRWNVLGGWFVQPDANMPSGESLVRQALAGKRYFGSRFGIEPPVAANLDPFGHSRGLVQILAKSGSRAYLFCRPDKTWAGLPADEFVWVGYDGSEVLAARASAHYNSSFGGARARVEAWLRDNPGRSPGLLLWGVGNHGGGASERDLDDLAALMKEDHPVEVVHSTADAFFAELETRRESLPRHEAGLNPWAVGCYTTMARVKRGHRRLEGELFSAEKMACAAAFQGLTPYPQDELRAAGRDLAFVEFHDLLPGSSVPPGEETALRLIDHGLEILSRVKARAFFSLAAGEKPAGAGTIPVFVFNPHPFRASMMVEAELQDAEPNAGGGYLMPRLFRGGKLVSSQPEQELSNLSLDWRKRVVFEADLQPGRLHRFDCRLERVPAKPSPGRLAPDEEFKLETPDLLAVIGGATGLLERYRAGGEEILAEGAFRPLVLEDSPDPWGMTVRSFRKVAGAFTLLGPVEGTRVSGIAGPPVPSVRLIEDGPVRAVVESVLGYGRSSAVIRYKIPKRGTRLEIEVRVLWAEKDRMLKLSLPTRLAPARFLGQTVYGREELPSGGDEAVSQKWLALVSRDRDLALTVVNDGIHGSDYADGELRLSLLRGAAYAADPAGDPPGVRRDRALPRIDQGERVFRFWIDAGPRGRRLEEIEREAQLINEPPYVLAHFPPGTGKKAEPAVAVSGPAVLLGAMKKAEDGDDLVLRLFEPTGEPRRAVVSLPFAGLRIAVRLRPFEIKTLRIDPRKGIWREVDLLERPLPRR